jgi:hypothetical protein
MAGATVTIGAARVSSSMSTGLFTATVRQFAGESMCVF